MTPAGPTGLASTSRSEISGVSWENKWLPVPRTIGNTIRRNSSTSLSASRVRTRCPLPATSMSPPGPSFMAPSSLATSPRMTVVGDQAGSSSVLETTIFFTALILLAKSPVCPGHAAANPSNVLRPRSRASAAISSSTLYWSPSAPRSNCNAQPPRLKFSAPPGSSMTPSSVTNSVTTILRMCTSTVLDRCACGASDRTVTRPTVATETNLPTTAVIGVHWYAILVSDGLSTAGPAPATRQRPGRCPVLRAFERIRPRARGRLVAGPLQSRIPTHVRRISTCLPAHSPPRAGRRAVAHHRPVDRGHLRRSGSYERRFVHDQLHSGVRPTADGLPRVIPASRNLCADPGVRVARIRSPATPHVSRRQGRRLINSVPLIDQTTQEEA